MELFHPDEPFDFTLDTSNSTLGAVISQNGEAVTFFSRTLSQAELYLATNERELQANIWALTSLRNYIFGSNY